MSVAVPILQKRIKKWLGWMYSSNAHSESDIIDYINSAIRHLSTDALFPFLVFDYVFKADGKTNRYPIPTNYSTRCIYRDGKLLKYNACWKELYKDCKWACQSDIIYISNEYIILPDSNDTSEYRITYRGLPKKIDYSVEWHLQMDNFVDVPDTLEDALVHLSLYYWFIDIKETDSWAERLSMYKDELKRLKSIFSDTSEINQTHYRHYF